MAFYDDPQTSARCVVRAGATKSAKRRAAKQRTLVEQLAAAGAGVRVINRGVSPGDLPPAARPTGDFWSIPVLNDGLLQIAALTISPYAPVMRLNVRRHLERDACSTKLHVPCTHILPPDSGCSVRTGSVERFPSLPHSASEPSLRPTTPDPPQRHPARGSGSASEAAAPPSQEVSAPRPSAFPALQGTQGAGAAQKARPPAPAASPAVYASATASGGRRPPAPTASAAAPSAEAFPSLGGGQSGRPRPAGAVPAAYAARSNAAVASQPAQSRGAQAPAAQFPALGGANSAASAPASRQGPDPSASAAAPGTVSEALKAANKVRVAVAGACELARYYFPFAMSKSASLGSACVSASFG